MARTVWKYPLAITDQQFVAMPGDAEILTVQVQGDDEIVLWALVDPSPSSGVECREIAVHGTSNPMPDDPGDYVGTVQTHGGRLVWHVYDTRRRS